MSTSPFQRVRHRFEENNPLTELFLGLLSVSGHFARLLDRYAPSGPSAPAGGEPEPAVEVVLGIIALRRRLEALIDHAALASGPASTAPTPTPGGGVDLDLSEVLR